MINKNKPIILKNIFNILLPRFNLIFCSFLFVFFDLNFILFKFFDLFGSINIDFACFDFLIILL